MMQRIAVLGSLGSGKSTLAAQLGILLDLPVIHLDELFWATWDHGSSPSPDQIRKLLVEVVQQPKWIIDGIHGGQAKVNARRARLEAADTIIYLDLSPLLCVLRLVQRRLLLFVRKPKVRLRPNERLTWGIMHAAWTFRSRKLKDEVEEYTSMKRVIILSGPRDTTEFIKRYAPRDMRRDNHPVL
jgi:adenylate kinase family enzyme